MSVYAPSFRSSNLVNIGQLDTELSSELASKLALNHGPGSVQSTASGAYVVNQSFTCEVDDLVEVDFSISLGATSATIGVDVLGRLDGADVCYFSLYGLPNPGTGGQGQNCSGKFYAQDISGSHSAQLYLNIWSGSGTVYTRQQFCTVKLTKRR